MAMRYPYRVLIERVADDRRRNCERRSSQNQVQQDPAPRRVERHREEQRADQRQVHHRIPEVIDRVRQREPSREPRADDKEPESAPDRPNAHQTPLLHHPLHNIDRWKHIIFRWRRDSMALIDTESGRRCHTIATRRYHHVSMLDIEMARAPLFALVRATGTMHTADEVDTFTTALEFVPYDDDLVLDLTGLRSMSTASVPDLCALLLARAIWSEIVVVSPDPDITVQLMIGEVDHVVPVLTKLVHATDLIRARHGIHTVEVGI